jgi:hypothetical protein
MFYADCIRIKISGSDECLNAFSDNWWTWSNKNLRIYNTMPEIRLESGSEILNIYIYYSYPDLVSLGIFDILAKKFHQLNFVLNADELSADNEDIIDKHVLVYQNGEKIKHFQKYVEFNRINKKGLKEIIYRADHVNKKLQILEEYIHDGDGFTDKSFNIVYENYFVPYIEEAEENQKTDKNAYKIWF